MIDRERIETMQRRSESWYEPLTISPEALSELCRVYLAWLDAPEGRADLHPVHSNAVEVFYMSTTGKELDGKQVRLVEVK